MAYEREAQRLATPLHLNRLRHTYGSERGERLLYEKLDPTEIAPEKFLLIVGNSRSGTTISGAIVDSHPKMLCANESSASSAFWRGMDKQKIFQNIVENCRKNIATNRASQGYLYTIPTPDKVSGDIAVMGDKIWNPALLLLAGQRDLISTLENRIGSKAVIIHCVRNPFDVIATMHKRSGASLEDRLGWYTMHCEAINLLIARAEQPIFLLRHEDLIENPLDMSRNLFHWLGYPARAEHLVDIGSKIFREPRRSRFDVDWSAQLIAKVDELCRRFHFLNGYEYEVSQSLIRN